MVRDKCKCDVTIIGPAIVDIMAGPIGKEVFAVGTMPMEDIRFCYGGNAYNESVVLSRYGVSVALVSKVGNDEAGQRLMEKIGKSGINTDSIILADGLSTSINIVLFDEIGERRFLTNPKGSLRQLAEDDIIDKLDDAADIVCFSCMFISPRLSIASMGRIFQKIKEKENRILVVDMTKAKNGETIEDLYPLMKYIDYILPNEEELKILSKDSIEQGAERMIAAGVGCVVVKLGAKGCKVFTNNESYLVDSYRTTYLKDTTGAGDCFAAGFIYGLLHKMKLVDCARFANATASCCVEQIGATEGILSIEEPMRRFNQLTGSSVEE